MDKARLAQSDRPGEFRILVHDQLSFSQLQQPHRIDAIKEVARSLTGASWDIRVQMAELSDREKPVGEEPGSQAGRENGSGTNSDVEKTLEIFKGRVV